MDISTTRLSALERRIPGLVLLSAYGVHPFQAEGYYDRWSVLLHAKSGRTTLRLYGAFSDPLYEVMVPSLRVDEGQSWFEHSMITLFPQLRRAQRVWWFEAVDALDEQDGEPLRIGVHGHTPEQAYAQILNPSEQTMLRYGGDRQEWIRLHSQHRWNPQTITTEDRIWPAVDPAFRVLPA